MDSQLDDRYVLRLLSGRRPVYYGGLGDSDAGSSASPVGVGAVGCSRRALLGQRFLLVWQTHKVLMIQTVAA